MGVHIEIIDSNNDFGFKMADFAKVLYTVPNVPNQI